METREHLREVMGKVILEENLLEAAKDLRLGQRAKFQHDNDPKQAGSMTRMF